VLLARSPRRCVLRDLNPPKQAAWDVLAKAMVATRAGVRGY
jgi:hypothetical protein